MYVITVKQSADFALYSRVISRIWQARPAEDGKPVQVWNPLEAIKAEIEAAQAEGAQKASEAVAAVAPTTSTVTSPETKTSRLLPEQEQVLLRFFGAQDRVDHREAALLARQASCSEQQVRQYLANLRSNLRSFIQRAQRNAAAKASGLPNGAPGAPAAQPQRSATDEGLETAVSSVQINEEGDTDSTGLQADRARQKAFGRLETYLDENGGIKDPTKAGNFANFMRNMRLDSGEQPGFTVWQAQLQAIVRTTRTLTLTKLAAVPDLVPTLATMLKAAEQDQQISFIRQLLQALRKLPFPWAMLEGQDLLKRVLNLQKHRLPRIASAAAAMARHWQELGGLGAVPLALPFASPGARPSKGLAVPYGQYLAPPGAAHSAYLPPPPASSNAIASEPGFAGSTGMQPAAQDPQDQQPAQYLQHSSAAHSDAGPSASGFGDRSGGFSQPDMRQGSGPRAALGPAQAYTRGLVPRKRSNMGPAKPLTADEIVKANAKKRAAGGQIGVPAKLGRLDAATMAALGRKSSALASGNLIGQGSSQFAAQGSGQLPGQFTVQGSGQFTTHRSGAMLGHGSGPDSRQFATQSSGHIPGQSTGLVPGQGPAPGQVPASGQGPAHGMAGSSQMMQSGGPAPGLTPGPGPVSPGLPSLSPMGPGGLLSPSGLGNLFNDEDVARLQPALSALPPHPSPHSPLMRHQHPGPHYSQAPPFQAHQHHQPADGLMAWPKQGHTLLTQATTEAALARMKATVAWAPLVTLLVPHVPDQVVACAGEESTEAAYQARRQSVNPEVRYIMAEDVSPDPYEPYEVEELQQPPQPPAFLLPFVPIDADERVRLSQKMAQHGVTDPQHLSCAEPVDIVAHNPSPTELAPLDMGLHEYEMPGGFSSGHVHDFGLTHPVQDLNVSLPQMSSQPQMYYRTYEQHWPVEQPNAFMMPADVSGMSHGNNALRSVQQFDLPLRSHSGQYWH
ncbi:hypothetical protein WJX79_010733 [Trebouxia sp. C0005]